MWLVRAFFVLAPTAVPAVASPEPYFPESLRHVSVRCEYQGHKWQMPVLTDLQVDWYSGMLAAAREPSLFRVARSKPDKRVLRFTWLRSFDAPVTIRVEWAGFSGHLFAKQLSGAGGYAFGKIAKTVDRDLSAWEIVKLRYMLWRTQILSAPPQGCLLGLDGADWVFEVADERGYRFSQRWSPETGNVREAGLFMIKLTDWTFKDIY
jgi:hypothetical protein